MCKKWGYMYGWNIRYDFLYVILKWIKSHILFGKACAISTIIVDKLYEIRLILYLS